MKIGIITLYRGYNYGTSLQAYALRKFVASLGHSAEIIWTKQGATLGRDIRCNKICRIFFKIFFHPSLLKKTFLAYKNSLSKPINDKVKKLFISFIKNELKIKALTNRGLTQYAYDTNTKAIICGSDQIWNTESANIDPLYFLQFAPKNKRIAYAPSFGRNYVPSYNKKILTQYLNSIPYISVREESGAEIVRTLTGRDVPVLIDPTLLLDWRDWIKEKKKHYIVAYFLDTPSRSAIENLKLLSNKYHYPIYIFPYSFPVYSELKNAEYQIIGPKDFVNIIANADCVFTDSFHGTIFSVNLEVPFWTFERNYATGKSQSGRILSILSRIKMEKQYIKATDNRILDIPSLAFEQSKQYIHCQREISKHYLINSFRGVI